MQSDFATVGRIIFGLNKILLFPGLVESWGKKPFLITGQSRSYGQLFFDEIAQSGWSVTEFSVGHEPDLETIDRAVELARRSACDFVIGFGGGSVIDTGKAVSALMNNDGELLDYLEVVGKGFPLKNPSKKYIAIPTTAGTGSEVTKNAVISVPDKNVKVSMRSPFMLPDIALIDPQWTVNLPAGITATTGMDAFIQVIEPYVCNAPDGMVDIFCRDAIPRAAASLVVAYERGEDLNARVNMSWVSLLGGLSLANARLGAVHGFAGPIGGMFDAPHGAICAALLPAVMKVNADLLRRNGSDLPVIQRYKEISKWATGKEEAGIDDGVEWFSHLCTKLGIQPLRSFGISENDFPAIIEKAGRSSSMKGNPVKLDYADMARILEIAL